MRTIVGMVLVLCGSISPGEEPKPQVWDFEDAALGKLPRGWWAAKTGEGNGSLWMVVEDRSAPGGAHVMAQIAAGPRSLFNLCIVSQSAHQNLDLSVAFKAVDGKVDQGGGVVWRLADPNNYYIARYNPLEDNFRLYKVANGKRIQLAAKEALKAPSRQWHTLSIRMKGESIRCSLNGTTQLEAKDDTFAKAGKIGLWTKADARTYFDKMEAKDVE